MVLLTGPWLMKRGALQPPYRGTIRRADKSPVDLSDPQIDHINFVMRQRRTLVPVVEAAVKIIQAGDANTGTDVGVCEYDWKAGDTDASGDYYGEFAVYDATGNVLVRIPNDSYQEIRILGNLSTTVLPPAPSDVTLQVLEPNTSTVGVAPGNVDFVGTGMTTPGLIARLTSSDGTAFANTSAITVVDDTRLTASFPNPPGGSPPAGQGYGVLLDSTQINELSARVPFTWAPPPAANFASFTPANISLAAVAGGFDITVEGGFPDPAASLAVEIGQPGLFDAAPAPHLISASVTKNSSTEIVGHFTSPGTLATGQAQVGVSVTGTGYYPGSGTIGITA